MPLSKTIGKYKYKYLLIHKWCSTSRKWLKSKSGGCFNLWHHLHKFTSQFVQISFGSLFWCIGTWPKGKSQRFPFGFRLDPASAKERFSMWHFWSSLGLRNVTSFKRHVFLWLSIPNAKTCVGSYLESLGIESILKFVSYDKIEQIAAKFKHKTSHLTSGNYAFVFPSTSITWTTGDAHHVEGL